MDAEKIYKYSLLLPMIVPVLVSPAALFLQSMSDALATVVLMIIYSGLVGGIPYLILAAILFWWMRNKKERQIRKALMLSPLYMTAIFVYLCAVSVIVFNNGSFKNAFSFSIGSPLFCIACILVFGYSYILLTFGLVKVFGKSEKRLKNARLWDN